MLDEFKEELERCVVFYKVRPSERLWNRFKTLCQECEAIKPDFIRTALFGNKKVPLLYFVLVTHQLLPLAKIVIQLQPESVYYVSEGTQYQTVLSHVYLKHGEEWGKMINLLRRLDTFTSTSTSDKSKLVSPLKKKKTKRTVSLPHRSSQTKQHERKRSKSACKKSESELKPLIVISSNPKIECDWPFCGQSFPFDEFQEHSRSHILNSINSRGLNEFKRTEFKQEQVTKSDSSASEEEMIRLAMAESLKLS